MQPCSSAPRSSTHRRRSGVPALSCDLHVCVSGLPASSQGSPSRTLFSAGARDLTDEGGSLADVQHHGHIQRRPRGSAGAGVHPGQQDPLPDSS